jgi:ubiquinone/menaquinone biosynthesis C-methylase UbiE
MTEDVRSSQVARLYEELAPTYDQSGVPFFRPIANRLVELLDVKPGEHALDVGCGRGAVTLPLADAVGPAGHVTAIDLSQAMVDLTHEEVQRTGRSWVDVRRMDAAAPDLPSGAFDVAASSLVVFFVPNPGAALEAWLGLLKPRGRLGITTFGDRDPVWQSVMDLFVPYLPPDMLGPAANRSAGPFASEQSVAQLLQEAGAEDISTVTEPLGIRLADAQAWREWSMTQGQRGMWMSVPAGKRDYLFERAAALLENARCDGDILLTTDVRYTIARAALR